MRILIEQPSLEEAMNYITTFGGYDKAWMLRSRACFINNKEYYYHQYCLKIFCEFFDGEFE